MCNTKYRHKDLFTTQNMKGGSKLQARNYPKLRGAIREKYGTQASFAEALGVNTSTLSKKLAKKTPWLADEVKQVSILLDIPIEHVALYFFAD